MIKHLHCLFVVIKWERTSVDHRLKTPLSYATMNRYKWVACRAMHNWINVLISSGVPVILLFLTRPSKEFEEKSGSSKKHLDFSRQIISWPSDFLSFSIACFILPKINSLWLWIHVDDFRPNCKTRSSC